MANPARKIARKKASHPARTARRPTVRKPARPAPAQAAPKFTRIRRNVVLVAPPGYVASLILKQVAHDRYRYYACWLLVGRYDQDALSVRYKFTGEDTLRCDIPYGMVISAAALQPYLVKFLRDEGTESDDPPIIVGKGKGQNP
jgi:hypothetical protein